MVYVGHKDGLDIYKDPYNDQFYVDDGWDVSRVGKAGFVPHPIDHERLKQLCTKYNPQNVPWVDFMLASFEGREDQLWRNFFDKYQLGPKPNEPTWGKGIRKTRWAEYGKLVDEWEAKKNTLMPAFQDECRQWDQKRRAYVDEHSSAVTTRAGQALLQRALSAGSTIVVTTAPSATTTYRATVPGGLQPGDNFMVNAGGQMLSVKVPTGAFPGKEISFVGPAVQAQVIQPQYAPAYSAPLPPIAQVPPAINTSAPPPSISSVPPAILSAPPSVQVPPVKLPNVPPQVPQTTTNPSAPPPVVSAPASTYDRKSSMKWS